MGGGGLGMRLPVTCINPLFVITLSKGQLYCAMDKLLLLQSCSVAKSVQGVWGGGDKSL